MKNIFSKYFFTAVSALALAMFVGSGALPVGAQTTTTPLQAGDKNQSDFRKDVEKGKQQIADDKDAQNNQREIDNEEDEKAGDQYGEHQAIDGEKSEQEIEQEIENEAETEVDNGSKDGEDQSKSPSTPSTSSEGN